MAGADFERDLHIARQIQASFLPDELPQPSGWEIAVHFSPAREVAGDFYDAFPLVQNRRMGFVIADVCDKGVGAALFMALFRTLIRAFAQHHHALTWTSALAFDDAQPNQQALRHAPSVGVTALQDAVEMTNSYIATTHAQANMYATLFMGVLDAANGHLAYVNAGHETPLVIGKQGVRERLVRSGPVIGLFADANFNIREVQIAPGETLVAFTDGVTEACDASGELFGRDRLTALLANSTGTAQEVLDGVVRALNAYTAGADQSDDITILVIRRKEE